MKGTSPGTVIQGAIVNISDNLLLSSDAEVTHTGDTSMHKKKEFAMAVSGYFRITFEIKYSKDGIKSYGHIYRNGVAWGTRQETVSPHDTYQAFSEDLIFGAGDLLQLYIGNMDGGEIAYAKLLRIHGDESVGAGVEAPV